jgi:signal transduction histidine kinase
VTVTPAPPLLARVADRVFYPLLALYSLYALGWLVLGLGFGAVADIAALHHAVDAFAASAAPHSLAARVGHGLQVGIMHSETGVQVVLDYLFSLLNIGLSIVLLRTARSDWTVRLLVVGMVGSSGAFNLQAHADIYAVQDAFGVSIGWWHTALLHGVGGVCYVFALLMFPTGSLGFGGTTRWLARVLVFAVVAATVGLLSVSTASYPHPVSFVVFFGLLAPVAGVAAQLRRYSTATTAESRQQSRVLLWALFMAFGVAAILSAVTIAIATIHPAGFTTDTSDALFFWICRAVFTMIPLALLVGVLRFRLWDVELLLNRTFVYGVLTVLIGGLYVGVVVLADFLLAAPGRADLAVQLVAGAAVVLALRPAQARVSALADRLVYGRRPAPYDVLARLSALSRATVTDEAVLPRLARVTGEGLHVASCEVRLRLPDGTDQRYRWPDRVDGQSPGHTVAVFHAGEQVGEFVIDRGSAAALAPQQRRLLADLAHGAGLVLRAVQLTMELEQQLAVISRQAEEIGVSRRRIIRAQEAERRTLERNLHDGAQPRLVAVRMTLGLLAHLIGGGDGVRNRESVATLVDQLDVQLTEADHDLAELSNGLYPALLREQGLLPALRGQAVRLGVHADFAAPQPAPRLPGDVEAAVCLAVLEALQNAAKHAPGAGVRIELWATADESSFVVSDDGPGFVVGHERGGVGLQSMADRIAAAGGQVTIESAPGRGTTVSGRIPLTGAADRPESVTLPLPRPR